MERGSRVDDTIDFLNGLSGKTRIKRLILNTLHLLFLPGNAEASMKFIWTKEVKMFRKSYFMYCICVIPFHRMKTHYIPWSFARKTLSKLRHNEIHVGHCEEFTSICFINILASKLHCKAKLPLNFTGEYKHQIRLYCFALNRCVWDNMQLYCSWFLIKCIVWCWGRQPDRYTP